MEIKFKAIGYIKSPFTSQDQIPKQSIYAEDKRAKIILEEEYKEGLLSLEKGDNIVLLFNFHNTDGKFDIQLHPHGSKDLKGVFATRSPSRPNPIGMSIVEITDITNGVIEFKGVDMLDGTPVLDIKPYSPGLNP